MFDFTNHTDSIEYSVDSGRSSRVRKAVSVTLLVVVVFLLIALGMGLGAAIGYVAKHSATTAPTVHTNPPHTDICTGTVEARKARAELLYTNPGYLTTEPVQVSDDKNRHWCVFGTNPESDLWWGIAYIGDDNPVYRTMLAENGYSDSATRAVIMYQGIPPLKFARDGWVAFITPSGSVNGDVWTAFKAGAGVRLLMDIADHAEK